MRFTRLQAIVLLSLVMMAGAAIWVGASTTGIISGTVKTDTGTPLSGANILVDGTDLTAVTDKDGRFTITNVPPGEYKVSVEMVGYATQTLGDVQVTMDATAEVAMALKQEATAEEMVLVTRPRPMVSADSVNTLTLMTAQQEPLTRLDPANIRSAQGMLSALPGVVVEADGSGQMHVRGGRPDQVGWYLEGMPITDPNTGMFGTNLYTTGISKFQTYTGGFGAEYGNAISGVLNEVKKTGAASPGFGINMESGDQSYWDGFAEVGGGSADTFNYYVGSALQATDLDAPLVKQQQYTDSVAKLVWPSKDNTYSVLAMFGSLDGKADTYHDTGDNGVATPHEKDFMNQKYNVSAFTWSHNFSPRSFITVRPYHMETDITQNLVGTYGMYANVWSKRNGMQLNYTNQMGEKHLVKAGTSWLASDNYYYLFPGFPYYTSDVDTSQYDMFVEDQIKLSDKWTTNLGIRRESITYDRTGNAYVSGAGYTGDPVGDATVSKTSPRMGLSYAADDRTVWKASWGKYAKFVPANTVQRTYVDPDLVLAEGYPPLEVMTASLGSTDPQTSTQMELSYEKQVSDTVAVRVTPFYAKYQNLGDLYMDPDTGASTYANLGEGKSRGIEMFVRKKVTDNWQGWLSYTYQKTESNRADLGLVNDMYPTAWDQRHTLSLITDYKTRNWTHSLRADFGSGRADRGDPTVAERANPSFVLNYNFSVKLPKHSGMGDRLHVSIYNLLDNHQTTQYTWSGADRTTDGWVPERFISMGVSSAF